MPYKIVVLGVFCRSPIWILSRTSGHNRHSQIRKVCLLFSFFSNFFHFLFNPTIRVEHRRMCFQLSYNFEEHGVLCYMLRFFSLVSILFHHPTISIMQHFFLQIMFTLMFFIPLMQCNTTVQHVLFFFMSCLL